MTYYYMGLFNFGFGSLEKRQEEKKNKEEEKEKQYAVKMSRRDFLKLGAKAVTYTMVADTAVVKGYEYFGGKEKGIKEEAEEEKETEEQKKIAEEDTKSLSEILDYKKDKIELNSKTAEQVKNHWREQYKNGNLKDDFIKAYYEIGAWQGELEKIFEQEGVPKKYVHLAIPESHWQIDAVSKAKAVGPYQFIKETAKVYGLKMDWRLDERKDPLKSGQAAAQLLKHLYDLTGDWNLALSGYNGGYLKGYMDSVKEENKQLKDSGKDEKANLYGRTAATSSHPAIKAGYADPSRALGTASGIKMSYEKFLEYMQNKITDVKKEVSAQNIYNYKVKKGDTLLGVAEKFGLNPDIIKCRKDKKGNLFAGEKITIHLNEKGRKEVFNIKTSGFRENLNYPQKFDAVYELIDEGFVSEQKPAVRYGEIEVTGEKIKYAEYKVKPGDGLLKIAKQFNINASIIQKENLFTIKGLKSGDILKIPTNKVRPMTLEVLAEKRGIDIKKLSFLNPAIKQGAPIPDGYKIRV